MISQGDDQDPGDVFQPAGDRTGPDIQEQVWRGSDDSAGYGIAPGTRMLDYLRPMRG